MEPFWNEVLVGGLLGSLIPIRFGRQGVDKSVQVPPTFFGILQRILLQPHPAEVLEALPLERADHRIRRVLDPILQDVNDFYLAGGVVPRVIN